MADDSRGSGLGKLFFGGAVGFGLYMLVTGLGFGGFGRGTGRGAGEGRADEAPPAPGPPLPAPPPPPPKDELPLLFWMFNPQGFTGLSKLADPTSRAHTDSRFLQIDLGTAELSPAALHARVSERLRRDPNYKAGPSMTIDDVIARVRAGGRDDVRLMTSGGTISGTYEDVKDALMAAGIKHWQLWEEVPADKKPGAPAKPARWDLYDKGRAADLNPDKQGHYHFENRGTAFWNLAKEAPRVSGNGRGQYGARPSSRGAYR